MSWRDRLRPASFRGVPFYVEALDADLGRKVEILKFPGRNDVVGQDLGLDARAFSVTAYVIGANYDVARNDLESALLERGPGLLVLPWRGETTVLVHDRIKISDGKDQGGYARIVFQVIEHQPNTEPLIFLEPGDGLRTSADGLIATLADEFDGTFGVGDLPTSVAASQLKAVRKAGSTMKSVLAGASSLGADLTSALAVAQKLVDQADAYASVPADLADAISSTSVGLFAGLTDLVGDARSVGLKIRDAVELVLRRNVVRRAIRSLRDLTTGAAVALDTTTPTRERETTNLRAFDSLVRVSAVAGFARALPSLPWSSYGEATGALVALGDVVDSLEADVSDPVYGSLRDLETLASDHLRSVASSLPDLREIELTTESSALLVAHQVYGDARREWEVVARNGTPHPGLIDDGTTLEVASA